MEHQARTQSVTVGASLRAFTLLETLVVVIIIGVLVAVLIPAISGGLRSSREGAERALVNSLRMATDEFRQRFGFLPALVDDSNPIVNGQPNTRSNAFLRREEDAGNPVRYSTFSIPYYLMGIDVPLPDGKPIDGALGASFTRPTESGQFTRAGAPIEAPLQSSGATDRLNRPAPGSPAVQLLDRWGTAIRYYRWLPTWRGQGSTRIIGDHNIPEDVIGSREDTPEVRSAEYAIVSAGRNRVFGDEDIAALRDALGLAPSVPEAEARRQAREDNIVEVGR